MRLKVVLCGKCNGRLISRSTEKWGDQIKQKYSLHDNQKKDLKILCSVGTGALSLK